MENRNYTIVSGLWNLSRDGRDFNTQYLPRFKEFLKIESNMILFLPEYLHEVVWEVRKPENTFIKIFELEDLKNLYAPHWDKTQEIRNNPDWLNITGEGGWLKTSPQATLEYYNPIVQSKMFMLHDASLFNPFNTDHFYWLDAGITNTVPYDHLVNEGVLAKLPDLANTFLFLSYPYQTNTEIHGFDKKEMDKLAGANVEYVCRGGLFGGHKEVLHDANATYYALLSQSLQKGYMGTEESLFSIMAYKQPHIYRRYSLDGNGLIVKFTEALKNNQATLESIPDIQHSLKKAVTNLDTKKLKTNLYILAFNFPEQLKHTINSMKKVPEWLDRPDKVLIDNSTNKQAMLENKQLASEYGFEHIWLEGNKGINGGRQAAAEHFHNSDADFMFFFEDDMTVNSEVEKNTFCRNGFRKYVPNLYETVHKVMLKENFDFLKLSFTEVYWDNNIQTSWYNVPQHIRTEVWPSYDKLPISGADSNSPRTKFDKIDNVDGLAYITGEVFYCNWPMIVSKKGNKKMFIDTKWAHPYEQTWMSHMFQETLKGNIKPALLLASPIWHERIAHYTPEERREN